MEEELKKLRKQRGRIRTTASKLLAKIPMMSRDTEIQGMIDSLHSTLNQLSKMNAEIAQIVSDDELDTELEDEVEYDLKIRNGISELKKSAEILRKREITNSSKENVGSMKLPKLQLPLFSGSKLEFHSFWDIFNASVGENSSLSDVQKFAYLKNSLTGEAAAAIGGLALTDSNFSVAMDILEKRFGSMEFVTREHLRRLQQICSPSSSVERLQKFYDEISMNVRCLKNLNIDPKSFEIVLLPHLMAKLPDDIKLNILNKSQILFGGKMDTFDEFLSLLSSEIEIRDKISIQYQNNTNSKRNRETFDAQQEHYNLPDIKARGTVTSLPTHSLPQNKTKLLTSNSERPVCVYCNSSHKPNSCSKIQTISDRVSLLKKEKRCFSCLKQRHGIRNCRSKRQCPNCDSPQFHHSSICINKGKAQIPISKDSGNVSSVAECISPDISQASSSQACWSVALPTAKVMILSPDGTKEIMSRVILDTASNRTYIRKDLCSLLNIPLGDKQLMKINTFGSTDCSEYISCSVSFRIKSLTGDDIISLSGYALDTICQNQPAVDVKEFHHLQDLKLADPVDNRDQSMETGILIGADFYYDIVFGTEVIRGDFGPVAVGSRLGWLIQGRTVHMNTCTGVNDPALATMTLFCTEATEPKHLRHQLQSFWDFDHMGILPIELQESAFSPNVIFQDNHYEVTLPWKTEKHKSALPTNFSVAYRRLQSVRKQLKNKPEVLQEYQTVFNEQCEQGIIQRVPAESNQDLNTILHYLPHSPVIRPKATSTKLRVVFDASAHEMCSPSINACLEQGTCSLLKIPLMLTSFRLHKIAFIADLEKAFHQIRIAPEDRDCLRFLWKESDESKLEVFRHVSLVFGLVCSPAILEHVIGLHLSKYERDQRELVQKLKSDLYVDNLVSGCETLDEAYEIFSSSRLIFKEAGFNLRQWTSNSKEFVQFVEVTQTSDESSKSDHHDSMGKEEKTFTELTLNSTSDETFAKVLGLFWDTAQDAFRIDLSFLSTLLDVSPKCFSKRDLLRIVSRIYDPLGFLAPIMTKPKLLFQKLCSDKSSWDSPVPRDMYDSWLAWYQQVCTLSFSIQRFLKISDDVLHLQLHGFSDASMEAYACAIYLRIEYTNGRISTSLIMAKARISPKTNPQTIPRLELMAATILSRLVDFVRPLFPAAQIFCWTDSQNVLHWIRGEHKVWKIFVQNRVIEIRRNLPISVWNYVPGQLNPADLPSRGIAPTSLTNNKLWWNGPSWLTLDQQQWPTEPVEEETVMVSQQVETEALPSSDESPDSSCSVANVISMTEYSSYSKLLRITAYVKRFVEILKGNKPTEQKLTSMEIEIAEVLWIKCLQQSDYSQEISHLMKVGSKTSLVRNLHLFMDCRGLIRCKGRMASVLPAQTNCPILSPRNYQLLRLIIEFAHASVAHGGVSSTLSKVRERFWILKGRQQVKKILRRCYWCKRVQGLPYLEGIVPDLPDYRIRSLRAFQTVGLDYCGPLYYRSKGEESVRKCYVCLFTCATTRAVHIELVSDLTADSFLRALKRFVARRGIPSIVSDNASTFKSAFQKLRAVSEDDNVANFCLDKRIVWRFICERAPWHGGFYERLVRDIKNALKKTIKTALLGYDELQTILHEIEGVLNSRPLSYVGEDQEIQITPAHFLILQRITQEPLPAQQNVDLSLHQHLRYRKHLLHRFWDEWKKSYLLSLRERNIRYPRGVLKNPAVGDIVLLVEEKVPRLSWKVGAISEVKYGRDGVARSALVRVRSGREFKLLRRPLRLLIPVESENDD